MKRLHRTVIILGLGSLMTDMSSEMIFPLLPVFLREVLGAGAFQLGVIEGIAEATASLLKMVSGVWTDRARKRRPFVVAGYGLSGLARPLIGLSQSWPFVLVLRFFDRVGKGIRSSPRDALIADVTDEGARGRAYGFHRSMDHAGAVVGPLIAGALLTGAGMPLRQVFLLASIPALAAWLTLWIGVREPEREEPAPASSVGAAAASAEKKWDRWSALSPEFRTFLFAVVLFTLGNATDAFLLARLSDAGIPAAGVAALWSAHHVVKMSSTWWGGGLVDRFGARRMLTAGWIFYAAIYAAFAFANLDSRAVLITVFLAYGAHFGLAEPAERVLVARLASAGTRGGAFGWFHMATGLGALPASILFGWLWSRFGAPAAFGTGAVFAVLGALVLMRVPRELTAAPSRGARPA